jgi:hypothetical protein
MPGIVSLQRSSFCCKRYVAHQTSAKVQVVSIDEYCAGRKHDCKHYPETIILKHVSVGAHHHARLLDPVQHSSQISSTQPRVK